MQIATSVSPGKAHKTLTPVINSTWIIDSGPTDHMTFDSQQVSQLKLSSQKHISTANETTTSPQPQLLGNDLYDSQMN